MSTSDSNENRNEKRQRLLAAEEGIRFKVLGLLRANEALVEGSTFTYMEPETAQLQALRTAQPDTINITADDTDNIGAGTKTIARYGIPVERNEFLDLACKPKKLYVREGYDELYKCICEQWKSRHRYRVILLGNAGTGKSWFQVYALKQLMSCAKDQTEFDLVIRQVGPSFFLIDLEEAKVYRWDVNPNHLVELLKRMDRTLYFFEPRKSAMTPPLEVYLPSLSTLSPCISRIKEYEKSHCSTFYFWPWSSGELRAVIQDSKLPIDDKDFSERYHKFGGIVRHILKEDPKAEQKLKEQVEKIDRDILTSATLNMDRDNTGNNISGFLICYDNRSINGRDRFAEQNLEYTSAYVAEEVQKRCRIDASKIAISGDES